VAAPTALCFVRRKDHHGWAVGGARSPKKLVRWLRAHGTDSAYVVYFGNAHMPYYGIDAKNFPDPLDQQAGDRLDGFAVATVTPLNGVYVSLDRLRACA